VLANPLNPVNPYVVVNQSPHLMQPSRDFQNYDLTIMPESRLRFRAGYNYNGSQGQTDTTFHAGTDILLVQPWRVTGQTYRFGADYRIFSQTTISYDQTFDTFKNDTFQVDQNQMFSLQNGTPVDIGLPFNPAAGLPCSTPFINGSYNPKCNGDFSYVRSGPVRSFLPTEQISLHSSFLKRVDLTARYAYSSGYSQVTNYLEEFNGLESRTNQREFAFTGPSNTKRVLDDGDLGQRGYIVLPQRRDVAALRDWRVQLAWGIATDLPERIGNSGPHRQQSSRCGLRELLPIPKPELQVQHRRPGIHVEPARRRSHRLSLRRQASQLQQQPQ
jgi:hypothetical protein